MSNQVRIVYACGHHTYQFNEGGGKYKDKVIVEECVCDACYRRGVQEDDREGA